MENTSGNVKECHLDRQILSSSHPGNRAEVFLWQNLQHAYRDPGWKIPDVEPARPLSMNISKILQRKPETGLSQSQPVVGKSMRSDWFFLGRHFAKQTQRNYQKKQKTLKFYRDFNDG